MIGRLKGQLIVKKAPFLLVDIQGVGYDVQAPMTTFYRLPELNAQVVLHTHFSVSETSQQLFGFASLKDRDLFRLLIKVNGVGPKMAIGIMSMETGDFVRCVMQDNVAALVKVPGVGKKTAERLMIEMRDRLKGWSDSSASVNTDGIDSDSIVSVDDTGKDEEGAGARVNLAKVLEDAESALVALGYKPAEASRALSHVKIDDATRSEDLIRAALKSMMPA